MSKSLPRLTSAPPRLTALFGARQDSLSSEVALMNAQRGRIEEEISALRAQITQAQTSLASQQQDLDANRALVKDGFISPTQLTLIESVVVDYAARLEERKAELARAAQRLVDNELSIKSIQNQCMSEASDQLKAAAVRLGETEQELRKSEDAARAK
jgi:HlyD family secretion protein